jgi:hypothetical protein
MILALSLQLCLFGGCESFGSGYKNRKPPMYDQVVGCFACKGKNTETMNMTNTTLLVRCATGLSQRPSFHSASSKMKATANESNKRYAAVGSKIGSEVPSLFDQ